MATMELDPLFIKALALLRSKSKDSTDLLKGMLDGVLGKTTGKFSSKPSSPKVTTLADKAEVPMKVATKRPADKSGFGAALSSSGSSHSLASKKVKVESEVRASRIQPRKPVIDDDDDDDDDDDEDDDDDDDDDHTIDDDDDNTEEEQIEEDEEKGKSSEAEGALTTEDEKSGGGDVEEMWLDLACIVCKEFGISAGNQLIECQECHNLYHQKCHSPPVTDTDHNDPRLVWYCTKCKRSMKKMASKKSANPPETVITTGSSAAPSSSGSSSSSGRDSEKNQDSMNLFRRADPKPSPTATSSKQQPFGGLASYAANLAGRQHSSSSKPNQSGPSRIITSSGMKMAPLSITSRSSSAAGTSTTMSTKPAKTQGVQRSVSVSQATGTKGSTASSGQSAAAKAVTSNTAGGKALPQTSTASAMKRLHMMKKKASKR